MEVTTKLTTLALLSTASAAFAAGEPGNGLGLGASLFLGFFAVILVLQAIPGLILLCSMLKGLFTHLPHKVVVTDNHSAKTR